MKLWDDTPIEERERIFKKLNYCHPDILAKRLWIKLPKVARENFKTFTAKINHHGKDN